MSRLWSCLEALAHGQCAAVPATWRTGLGGDFEAVQGAFLRRSQRRAGSYPCPHGCGCAHEVVRHRDGSLVAVCQCEPPSCEDIPLTAEDVAVWELSWSRLGRAVARAFGCDVRETQLPVAGALQVGSFGGAPLPVVLVMAPDAEEFRQAVVELVARLGERFIVLAPTNRFVTANVKEMLGRAKAGCFDLETNLTLLPNGTLQARRSGGELFSRYLPEQEERVSEEEARRVFGLMKLLDAGRRKTKAPLSKVFRLYVFERCSRERIARECDCVPSLVTRQLKEIERIMKRSREELQALASPLAEMGAAVEDSRARKIYRKGLTDDTGNGDED